MNDGAPALELGFVIESAGSFETLKQLQTFMQSTEYKTLQSAKAIEQATDRHPMRYPRTGARLSRSWPDAVLTIRGRVSFASTAGARELTPIIRAKAPARGMAMFRYRIYGMII